MNTFSRARHAALVFASLSCVIGMTSAQAKPKYGPEATVLAKSHAYVAEKPAPDFWAIMPYYTAQQSDHACSIAAVAMVVNAARSPLPLTSDDPLATQKSILAKVGDADWTKAVSATGAGRTLDQLGPLLEKSLKAYGFDKATAEVVHAQDQSPATQAKLHQALVENEKSAQDFLVINFIQGAYTGDADVGHIAPIAAYDAKTKRVLVMDPDRDWYEPYWVSEETLLKGMNTQDKSSGKSRGYVWVKLNKQ